MASRSLFLAAMLLVSVAEGALENRRMAYQHRRSVSGLPVPDDTLFAE